MTRPQVIVIDDEPQMVDLLTDMISLLGLTSAGYTCAETFLEDIEPDNAGTVVTLDLQMPGVDGIEVMRRLAELPHPPALILISGGDLGVLHAAEKLGHAHDLRIIASLQKPIQFDEFSALLQGNTHTPAQPDSTANPTPAWSVAARELRRAIAQDQLELHYQPQIRLTDGRLEGLEALVRWHHPTQGLIYPDAFISVAEKSGLIEDLSQWVIRSATRHARRSASRGAPIGISVNISPTNITNLTLPEQLTGMMLNYRMDTSLLTLELTETAVMTELVRSLDVLTRMRLKGIRLSIDDFGTGYSSLKQLHRIPFSELKIDRTFVANMRVDSEAFSIVKICIMLGHELDLQVIAEGVEDGETLDLLTSMGCDLAQGYHIARPMPETDLREWIRSRHAGAATP
jgi:EAL domain-containing protein (putative c-di-GMP-specific phosphodiesterase class I)/FixJ family two-component response regulator